MISTQDRCDAVTLIDEAVKKGARLFRACAELRLCTRTYRRWTSLNGEVKGDARPAAIRPTPANALSEAERQRLVAIASQPEFASLPPSQIVPTLADRGEYLASESSFYRVLKAVICQGSCPVTQAAFFSFLSSCLTGLSHTVAGRSQFRVVPRQRPGLAALAFS